MAANVNKLIEQSFKTAGLFTQDQRIEGSRIVEALDYLNEIIDEFSTSPILIAFYDTITFAMTAGKASYVLSQAVGADVNAHRLVQLKYAVVTYSGNRYPVKVITDYDYYSVIYNTSSQSRPAGVFLQNGLDSSGNEESTLTFIRAPDINYDCEIKGKFVLNPLSLNTNITNVPKNYRKFLRYALARELSMIYLPENWTSEHESIYKRLLGSLKNSSDIQTSLELPVGLERNYRGYYNNAGVIS